MSLPDWKKAIDTQFSMYKSGKQNKNGYLSNLISYFTGAGTGNYPVRGQKVNPTDLSPAELLKYELPDFDIRKVAFMQAIESNMVSSSRLPRDWAGVKRVIDGLKQDARFARSPPFDNYTADEKAIWNNCQIPIVGKGTTSSPTNHPLYNKLCDIYNTPGSKAFRDAGNWEKYYGDFAIGGIGPAGGFFAGDWGKNFVKLTQDQLDAFQLPFDDARRLQIAMTVEQYKNALAKKPSTTKQAYVANIQATYDDKKHQYSPPLTAQEKTMFESLKIPISPKIEAQMIQQASSASAEQRTSAAKVKADADAAAAKKAEEDRKKRLEMAIKYSIMTCVAMAPKGAPPQWYDEDKTRCRSCKESPVAVPGRADSYNQLVAVKERTCLTQIAGGGRRRSRSRTRRRRTTKRKRGTRRR
jgi:hypothetical protein